MPRLLFELAGRVFADLAVGLSEDDAGALADPNLTGNIGGRLLEPFLVHLDLRNRRIAWDVTSCKTSRGTPSSHASGPAPPARARAP